jgi:serine/threonine protein kinase
MLTHGTGTLADRYVLDEVVGRGGMADVFRATDTVLERDVAVKLLRTHAVTDRDRDRFRGEATLLAALEHPGLVAVLDAGLSDDDVPYLVMDLVDGTSLSALCQNGPVPGHRIARLGADLANVLSYVHERDIVHRDIKPSNILVGRDGVVRLADFGIARMLGDQSGHTATGTTIGTAAYIAPEQVRGETVSPASDIYSLGLVLLEALTGRRAYTGGPMEAALARLHTPPLIPTSLPTGWPGLLARMTDGDPASRPSAADAERSLRSLDTSATRPRRDHRRDDGSTAPVAMAPSRSGTQAEESPGPEATEPHRPSRRRALLAGGCAAGLLAACAVAFTLGTSSQGASSGNDVPAGVRADLQQPLQDLHEAVNR